MGIIRSTLKLVLDVPSWMGLNRIKRQSRFLVQWIKPIFTPRKKSLTAAPTFEEAMTRFNLTEKDLEPIMHRYIYFTLFYLFLGLLSIGYTIYLFFHKSLIAGFTTILISIIIFLKAFSSHFWYFEIKHRKLGCSLKEWFNSRIQEEGK